MAQLNKIKDLLQVRTDHEFIYLVRLGLLNPVEIKLSKEDALELVGELYDFVEKIEDPNTD